MKFKLTTLLAAAGLASTASANEGLYYVGSEAQESLPLKWTVGADLTWDSNVTPGQLLPGRAPASPTNPLGLGPAPEEEAFSIGAYVGLSFVNITPQQTLDVYAKLGVLYYLDSPSTLSEDWFPQGRVGVNWTRRFSERLRFSSRNFVAYELEPVYAYGFASSRQVDPYLFWETDNSIGYRWTERFATYSGFRLRGLDYDSAVANQDRFTWELYQQLRYQLTPLTVLTFDYRYADTDANGTAADSTSHFLLGGVEHRFSPNTIMILRAGAQIRQTDALFGSDGTNPFAEIALRSQVNEQFSVRAFARYSSEVYDTTRFVSGLGSVNFDDRRTLRLGLSAEYKITPRFSVYGGLDYIPTSFDDGRLVGAAPGVGASGLEEDLLNVYVGASVQLTETLYGTVSYNYTDSSSDFLGYDYDRSRVNLGVRAEF